MSGAIVIGKLPFHGDFVARGTTGSERRRFDKWLTASMALARDELGPAFDDSFDAAPPWRFAWHEGEWTAGVLAPSADSTGRRFPLLVALSELAEGQVEAAARFCEEIASDAIASRWSADRVLQTIDAAEIEARETNASEGWWNEELGERGRLGQRMPPGILSHMLASVAGASA